MGVFDWFPLSKAQDEVERIRNINLLGAIMGNRVMDSIVRREKMIAENTVKNNLTPARLAEVHKSLDLAFDEYVAFQEVKSLAHAMNMINTEEATTIYNYLGEGGPNEFNGQPLAVKAALTQWYQELLGWKIKGAKAGHCQN